MSFEKIGLLFLLSNKREIDAAKSHFLSSIRELILGLSSSLEVVNRAAGETGLPERSPLVEAALQRVDFLLQMALKFLPKSPETPTETWRQEILGSIIGVLDEEMARLKQQADDENVALKKQALQSVKNALRRHFIEEKKAPSREDLPPVEKESPRQRPRAV